MWNDIGVVYLVVFSCIYLCVVVLELDGLDVLWTRARVGSFE